MPGRSPMRATGSDSPRIAARRSAAPESDSAHATANRAETPLRWSTAGDSRTWRVKRATTSSKCCGTTAGIAASWRSSVTSSDTSSG
ncbi:unannotated protein [freshwater metagenome]|uniref:Unannotated protein n=1 Tax=freshwater metagenome TaxID=449393 RepID=A0A6J6T9T8_9ZZZZ